MSLFKPTGFLIIDNVLKARPHTKFIAILLGALVLLSSNGVAISSHYCGDKLQDMAFFGPAKKCASSGDEMHSTCSESNRCASHTQSVKKKSCCSDQDVFVKLGVENSITAFQGKLVELVSATFVEFGAVPFSLAPRATAEHTINFFTGPPLGRTAIRILFQVFRI